MGKRDLLINFPEELLCSQILTRLPLKEAVRFSAVSRKWCRAWTRLTHLKFSEEFFSSIGTTTKRKDESDFTRQNEAVDIINKIILMQRGDVGVFELNNCDRFEDNINRWLLWVSLSGVRCIDFNCRGSPMMVPASLFSCATLTSLCLKNFMMLEVPAHFQGFSQLVTCCLEDVELSEEAFKVLLRLSCLQNLKVFQCGVPSNWRMNSSSLRSLVLVGRNDYCCSMEANCPRLESIKIIKCSGLVVVNVCLPVCVHLETDFQFLKQFERVKSLRKITCSNADVINVKVFQSFPCLEELCIHSRYFIYFSEEDLGDLTLRLVSLKTFILNTTVYDGNDEKHYLAFLSWVLKRAPLLKTIRIFMDYNLATMETTEPDVIDALQFVNDLLNLARRFPNTEILLSRKMITPGGR